MENRTKNQMKTEEQWIIDRERVHGYKYLYPDRYVSDRQKLRVICKLHMAFYIKPNCHLQGVGCPLCAKQKSKSELKLLEFIQELLGKTEVISV